MIKVCHVTDVHEQNDIRILKKECCSLAKRGYDVHLVAPGCDTVVQGVSIHGIGDIPSSRVKRMLFFSRKAYQYAMKINADIYQFHDPELIPFMLRLKKNGKKVIFDCHENILKQFAEKTYIPLFLKKIFGDLFLIYITKSCSKFDAIISVDPYFCDQFKKINENTVLVANFPIIEELNINRNKQNYIVFAGGVSVQWNHNTIIDAINEFDNLTYVLCGRADSEYLEYLKTLPGWCRVKYLGSVPHERVLEILQNAVAGVALCSYSQNTNGIIGTIGNTKLFEIMMSEIPVVCTNFKSWIEIVEKEKCGYCINYNNKEELVTCLRTIIESKEISDKMAENGRQAVEKYYNWDSQKKNLEELYEKLLYK